MKIRSFVKIALLMISANTFANDDFYNIQIAKLNKQHDQGTIVATITVDHTYLMKYFRNIQPQAIYSDCPNLKVDFRNSIKNTLLGQVENAEDQKNWNLVFDSVKDISTIKNRYNHVKSKYKINLKKNKVSLHCSLNVGKVLINPKNLKEPIQRSFLVQYKLNPNELSIEDIVKNLEQQGRNMHHDESNQNKLILIDQNTRY